MHPSSANSPLKTKIAVLIFIFGCLLSTARIVKDAPIPIHLATDDIAKRSDQRFAAVKAELPQQGVVGYVGESGDPSIADYYLAQYALAPVVLDRSQKYPLVVGNFPNSAPAHLPPGLQLVRDFGNGVLLFADKDAR